jgi:hypothetical protein
MGDMSADMTMHRRGQPPGGRTLSFSRDSLPRSNSDNYPLEPQYFAIVDAV